MGRLMEGVDGLVEITVTHDRLELAGLLRIVHGEVVDPVAVDVAELVVGVEAERPGQPMHGARWDIGSGGDLAHRQGRDLARMVQNVRGALLELPAQIGIGASQTLRAVLELQAHRVSG